MGWLGSLEQRSAKTGSIGEALPSSFGGIGTWAVAQRADQGNDLCKFFSLPQSKIVSSQITSFCQLPVQARCWRHRGERVYSRARADFFGKLDIYISLISVILILNVSSFDIWWWDTGNVALWSNRLLFFFKLRNETQNRKTKSSSESLRAVDIKEGRDYSAEHERPVPEDFHPAGYGSSRAPSSDPKETGELIFEHVSVLLQWSRAGTKWILDGLLSCNAAFPNWLWNSAGMGQSGLR